MRVKIWHYYTGIFWLAMIEFYNFSQKGVKKKFSLDRNTIYIFPISSTICEYMDVWANGVQR